MNTVDRDLAALWVVGHTPRATFMAHLGRFVARVHTDQRGTISILTIPTLVFFVMLLGMLINVGRHVDDKIKVQNASDAAAYTGGAVLARGMNTLAFTNHLLSDVFALTAIMREARDKNSDQFIPEILQAWSQIGPIFARADFPKFRTLGQAIPQKVPLEQELVRTYSEMAQAISPLVLPVLEYVLQERLIPNFQRALVRNLPGVAQNATAEVARRYDNPGNSQQSQPQSQGVPLTGLLWRTSVLPVGYPDENDPLLRTLPAVDPAPTDGTDYNAVGSSGVQYLAIATRQREVLAREYLRHWNAWTNPNDYFDDFVQFFDMEGKMSQYANLWRIFCCGQLLRLLSEYPETNLPHVIRLTSNGLEPDQLRALGDPQAINQYIDANFNFLGVAYRSPITETSPGMFKNRLVTSPSGADPVAFAEVSVFIPRPRHRCCPWAWPVYTQNGISWAHHIDNWPTEWNLINQNWTTQLMPVVSDNLIPILQSPMTQQFVQGYQPPNLGGLTPQQIRQVNTH